MKNNFILLMTFLLLFPIAIYSQTGIGTISPDPSAILDVSSTSKGFLLPRHSTVTRDAIVSPAKGLMIFNLTNNELQTNTGTPTSPVWTASGIGATGPQGSAGSNATVTASNGLTISSGDVKLGGTLSSSTSINQDNNDFTLTTGTARAIINGNFQTKGSVYANVRVVTTFPTANSWLDTDYIVIVKVSGGGNIVLPDPTLNPGRVICIRNASIQAGVSGTYTYTINVPQDNTTIPASRAQMFVSDGTKWYLIVGV